MIKIRNKIGSCTAGEAFDFFSQYPDKTKLTPEIFEEFKEFLKKTNNRKRQERFRKRRKQCK